MVCFEFCQPVVLSSVTHLSGIWGSKRVPKQNVRAIVGPDIISCNAKNLKALERSAYTSGDISRVMSM